MLIHFMPSEISRLILGYLKEISCFNTLGVFLSECKHLKEYLECLQNGHEYPTNIGGKSLKEILQDYCRLKAAEDESTPVDNCTPLVQQLKSLLPQVEELLPQLKQLLASGVRPLHSTPFTAINHHTVLQKSRTRCAVVEAQRHNTEVVQQCPSQDDTSNIAVVIENTVASDVVGAVADTATTYTNASNINTVTTNSVVAVGNIAATNTDVTFSDFAIPNVRTTNARIVVTDVDTNSTSTVTTDCVVVTDAERPTTSTTTITDVGRATASTTTIIPDCARPTLNISVGIADVVSSATNATVVTTITGTTTTATVTNAGNSVNILAGSCVRSDVSGSPRPVTIAALQTDSSPTTSNEHLVENANKPVVTPTSPKLAYNSTSPEEIDDAVVWTLTQGDTSERTLPLEMQLLVDRASSPIVIEDSLVQDSGPNSSMEIDQSHLPLCTPVKFGIFSEDSNFRSPRRKCQLPKRRNAQTPSQSARKRNHVTQDEDSTTSLDCQSEESIGFSGLLDQLINNTALHEKLAENINKVVSTSVPVEPEEIVMEMPVKAIPTTVQIMPPPCSPTGSVLDTPSKELFVPESLIKDIVYRTESDPMFEELLTSFFDNIKIDSNTSSLDSSFPENLPLSSTSDVVQLQTSQPQASAQDSIGSDVTTMLNSVLNDPHTITDGSKTDKLSCSTVNMFSFSHNIQSPSAVNSVENINREVCVNDNALASNNLHCEAVKHCDTAMEASEDRHSTSPLQGINMVQKWTENLTETPDVLPSKNMGPVSCVKSSANSVPSNQNQSFTCESSVNVEQGPNNSSLIVFSKRSADFSHVQCSNKASSQHLSEQLSSKANNNLDTSTDIIPTVASNFASEQPVQEKFVCIEQPPSIEAHNPPDFSTLERVPPKELVNADVAETPQLCVPPNLDTMQSLETPYKSNPKNENFSTECIPKTLHQDAASKSIHLVVTKTTPAKLQSALVKHKTNFSVNNKQVATSGALPTFGMRTLMPVRLPQTTTALHASVPQVVIMPQNWKNGLGNTPVNTSLTQMVDSGVSLMAPRIGVMGEQPLLIQQPGGGVATLLLPASPSCNTNQVLMTIPGKDGMSTVQLVSLPPDGGSSADTSVKHIPVHNVMPTPGLKAPYNVRRNLRALPRRTSAQAKGKLTPRNRKRAEAFPGYSTSSEVIARTLFLPVDSPLPQPTPSQLSSKMRKRAAPHVSKATVRTTTTTAIITSATTTTTCTDPHSLTSAAAAAKFVTHTSEIPTRPNPVLDMSCNGANASLCLQKESSKATKIFLSTPAPSILAQNLPTVPEIIEHSVTATETPNTMSTFQASTSCTVSIIKSMPTFKTNVRDTPGVSYVSMTRSINQARTTPGRRQNQSRSPQLKSLVNSVRRVTANKPRGNHIRVLDFSTPPKSSARIHFTPKKQKSEQHTTLSPRTGSFNFFSNITKTLSTQDKLCQSSTKDKAKIIKDQINEKKQLPTPSKKDNIINSKQCLDANTVESRPSTSQLLNTTTTGPTHSPIKTAVGIISNRQSAKQSTLPSPSHTSRKTKRKQMDDEKPSKKTKRDKTNVLTAMDVETFLAKLHYVE